MERLSVFRLGESTETSGVDPGRTGEDGEREAEGAGGGETG